MATDKTMLWFGKMMEKTLQIERLQAIGDRRYTYAPAEIIGWGEPLQRLYRAVTWRRRRVPYSEAYWVDIIHDVDPWADESTTRAILGMLWRDGRITLRSVCRVKRKRPEMVVVDVFIE